MDPTVVALVGTICGGVGLKFVEYWLGRNKVRVDDAAKIRDELRSEITALRAENHQLEQDVDKWRAEYYDLRDIIARLNALVVTHGLDPPEDK